MERDPVNLTEAEKKKILDIYEKVLKDNEDELYLNQTQEYRDGFLDGIYLLYVALVDGARR